ncbi:MAG: FtsH protease activity modulator HflK, partial [Pseudomonadota bacterium]
TGLFGGRGGGGRGGRMAGARGSFGISLILIILVAVWALSGIYIVDEGRKGVVLQFGAFNKITDPGPHWYPRFIQSVEIVNVQQVRSVNLGLTVDEGLMLTEDENIVDVKFTVQYAVKDPKDFIFNVRNPDATLRQATESAMREVVGKNGMDFVITEGRSEVAARAQKLTQDILDGYKAGIVVTNLNMQDAKAPEQVQDAFDDAIKAREDKERQENEAEAYSNDILPKARGQAARINQDALAYREQVIARAEGEADRFKKVLTEYERAPKVTRERLYLESIESVLSNSSKVMVDVDKGNNLMYLPLDRVIPPVPSFDSTTPGAGQSAPSPSRDQSTSSRPRERLRRELR